MGFAGFSKLKVKKGPTYLASISYTVFLCHKLIMEILVDYTVVFLDIEQFFNMNLWKIIIVEWGLIFILAVIASTAINIIYKRINKLINNRRNRMINV